MRIACFKKAALLLKAELATISKTLVRGTPSATNSQVSSQSRILKTWVELRIQTSRLTALPLPTRSLKPRTPASSSPRHSRPPASCTTCPVTNRLPSHPSNKKGSSCSRSHLQRLIIRDSRRPRRQLSGSRRIDSDRLQRTHKEDEALVAVQSRHRSNRLPNNSKESKWSSKTY